MNLTESIKRQGEAKIAVSDVVSSAITFKQSSRELHDRISRAIDRTMDGVPSRHVNYVRGYADALVDQMIRQHIVHGVWHDDQFWCTSHRSHQDFAEKKAGWPGSWKAFSEWPEPGLMVWANDPMRVFFVQNNPPLFFHTVDEKGVLRSEPYTGTDPLHDVARVCGGDGGFHGAWIADEQKRVVRTNRPYNGHYNIVWCHWWIGLECVFRPEQYGFDRSSDNLPVVWF